MKVLQIIDEISKRNISLVSVARIIGDYDYLSHQSKLLAAKNLEKSKKVTVLKNTFKNLFFNSEISEIIRNQKPEVVHIHGLWRPIHLFFMIQCNFYNISLIVQPHGMLLKEALRSKSFLSYVLKIITLSLYRFVLDNPSFIAVTNEEKKSILRNFPNAHIVIIKNPFITQKKISKNLKKKFVYFGRFNKHKNIKEFIEAYISSGLGKNDEWQFEIYGIEDDKEYKDELLDLVKINNCEKNIKFLKPEFNIKNKFKIISESWCNILMSKSEILSLSVLEAFSVGTQSFVNKQISFPKWIKKYLILSSIDNTDLVKKLKFIKKQNISSKKIVKKEMINSFQKNYNFLKEKNYYRNLLNNLLLRKKQFKPLDNLVILSSNLLNSVLIPFLIVLSAIFQNNSLATDIGIVPGVALLITQIFSANSRSIILYNKSIDFFDKVVSFRIFIITPVLILTFIFLRYFYYSANFEILMLITVIGLFSWINEMSLSIHEKNKSLLFIKIFLVVTSLVYLGIFFNYYLNYYYLKKILLSYLFFQVIYFLYHLNFIRFNRRYFTENLKVLLSQPLSIASSFFNIFSVIIWRISLLIILGKESAGLFFAGFAIASFPGTVFNNIIGQIVVLNKSMKETLQKTAIVVSTAYIISLILLMFVIEYYLSEFYNIELIRVTIISLFGTIIMIHALYARHLRLSKNEEKQKIVFINDIIYGILIAPIVIILYYFENDLSLLKFAYVFSAILAFIVYKKIKV